MDAHAFLSVRIYISRCDLYINQNECVFVCVCVYVKIDVFVTIYFVQVFNVRKNFI